MNDKFDELAKAMAQPVARRAALKRFGIGLAAFVLAAFGLAPSAQAGNRGPGERCNNTGQCKKGLVCDYPFMFPNPTFRYCQYPHP
jgi:hypothetical protein